MNPSVEQQTRRTDEPCECDECYESTTHTRAYRFTYAEGVDGECPVLEAEAEAVNVQRARRAFQTFAEFHCKLGDQDGSPTRCDAPCRCLPSVSGVHTRTVGVGKFAGTNNCYVEIEVTATIRCDCRAS